MNCCVTLFSHISDSFDSCGTTHPITSLCTSESLRCHFHRYLVNVCTCPTSGGQVCLDCICPSHSAAHGLCGEALWIVTGAHIISRLTYGSAYIWVGLHMGRLTYGLSAWWSFCNAGERSQLEAVVTRLVKRRFLPLDQPTLSELVATADTRLFSQIVGNPNHVLAPLIPPSKSHPYNLQNRHHNIQIPRAQTNSDKNFIIRIILDLNSNWTQ